MTATTQNEKVLNYLNNGKTLTVKQARARFGIKNLTARISELRSEGYNIVGESVTFRDTGARGVRYTMKKSASRSAR